MVMAQEYLPHRIGMASGLSIGLSIGLGGIAAVALGALADSVDLETAMYAAAAAAVPACCALLLAPPAARPTASSRQARPETAACRSGRLGLPWSRNRRRSSSRRLDSRGSSSRRRRGSPQGRRADSELPLRDRGRRQLARRRRRREGHRHRGRRRRRLHDLDLLRDVREDRKRRAERRRPPTCPASSRSRATWAQAMKLQKLF